MMNELIWNIYIYIYIIYTPNLGLRIAIPGREREQGRFKGSTEGALREHRGAARGSLNLYPAIAAYV